MRQIAHLCLATLMTGSLACTTRVGDFTIVTSKNLSQEFKVVRNDVEGMDCMNMFLFIPLGSMNPSMEGALDDAINEVPGADAMTNAQFRRTLLFTLIFNQVCVRVTGDAISTN